MFDLDGKICLITGGAGSLGIAAARLLHDQGAKIALIDLEAIDLENAAQKAFGAKAKDVLCLAADVSNEVQVKQAIETCVDHFGCIDVLFSNAGNFGTVAPLEDYPVDVFESVLSVHVKGAFLMAKYVVPHMSKGSSIVITSSVAATRGDPGVYGYITAKHALTGLMRVLAKDLAPRGIRVNAIAPGPIENGFQKRVEDGLGEEIGRDGTEFFNEMIPLGRHGTADEIAASVLYLASAQSGFTTGHLLMADGGMSV
ncbi:NAD(P)-dependent dehydrogenase (short-subunit alcohol dehydrogenase family) [Pacificibacter maritimus]|uniref:NAD(P)-dependent dehydrogenase (Short-subunit alcohol dehydrogenase family) n=1 Tax=Pacificibacter maritimus TaxID=762213 RepID=A0A3N4UX38_9RHOB|nr:SDR family NAD(P)-dependent oxidoreductase [Pacificibacter maritimus]RPE72109.1 NAD(P)-dependent dehydrogenase (short-subunit alcohol dehydrogenase family) [Pacificibacter maritimus]